ncbi:AAC(3) family N-acetyltransferase [Pseudomonas sp. RL_15y_Pfl2_60]|uniref:AAC(3) family N-acetyltransferase n=1 Tax=Pseudomonas sp. RL_15y_Pfl2_60 TaxID=3088709 RepID=UPI0030DAF6D7
MTRVDKARLIQDFLSIGLKEGDTILIRAGLGSVGRIEGGANTFIDALLEVLGPEGTVVSLAFTNSYLFKRPRKNDAFDLAKKSYAGALPNAMMKRDNACRSKHPTCSYVAIGKHSKYLTQDHDHMSGAYEPVRKIVQLSGKNILVGCVKSSPGFTTAHLAEGDLGMFSLNIFAGFVRVYYSDDSNNLCLFKRKDIGLCSNSFYKFYAHYVNEGVLAAGYVGGAYSIMAPAQECYAIERDVLTKNKKFNICESKDCFTCNAARWDRVHHIPGYVLRRMYMKFKG